MLKAPFPYFGGKRRVAEAIWKRLGDPKVYVEPFCGSAAVLLARPAEPQIEIINDADGYVVNYWRALKNDPAQVAYHADFPCNETELHARHAWLMAQDIHDLLYNDVDYFDARIAGYWVYGQCLWIGSGWCRKVGNHRPKLIDKIPSVVKLQGVFRRQHLYSYFETLAERLKGVRVCCGDWSRVCTYCVTEYQGETAVFLDPPYRSNLRQDNLYAKDCKKIAKDAWLWAIEKGRNPNFRIALCGYEGDYTMPADWLCYTWKSHGYPGSKHKHRERIYFSPHCLTVAE